MDTRLQKLMTRKAWWRFLPVAALALLGLPAAKRLGDILAVENAVARDWEMSIGWGGTSSPDGRPTMLPAFVDAAAKAWFDWRYAATFGYDGSQPVKTRNRGLVYHERFRALFRGPIEEIHIGYPESFRGDLGAALARFPRLRRFSIIENEDSGPTEADWTLLCARLRTLPNLEEIELGGSWITDAAITPLSGHPTLRSITISEGRLTSECAKTFTAIPLLAALHFEGQRYTGDTWLSPEAEKTLRASLPTVTVTLP